ncbi:MAG: hypothetical protein AB7K68_04070 [Bacteriovoracia bacterium]
MLKELTALTQDADFPKMRAQRGRLLISNENGEHLTVVFFQKDGAVTFNGKEWKIQPLATPEAEVKRITEILTSRNALFDFVVPSAFAGGMSMTKGVAAAAYASAAAWKGLNCAMPQLSDEALRTCPLMAVGMQGLTPLDPKAPINSDTVYPIKLKCPADNNGILELTLKRRDGSADKLEIDYSNGNTNSVSLSVAENSNPYKVFFKVKASEAAQSKFAEDALWVLKQGDAFNQRVCTSNEVRKRFNELANANAIELQKSTSLQYDNEYKKSSSGI